MLLASFTMSPVQKVIAGCHKGWQSSVASVLQRYHPHQPPVQFRHTKASAKATSTVTTEMDEAIITDYQALVGT